MTGFVNALLLCLLVPHAGAMFEDQAGLVDWYRSNIGRVQVAGFPRITRGNKFGYLATAENLVAAINLRTGETAWRQATQPIVAPVL